MKNAGGIRWDKRVVLPLFGIADGSVREALSVPYQQTARYIQKHGDAVTSQESTGA